MLSVYHNGSHYRTQSTRVSFPPDVLHGHDGITAWACNSRTGHSATSQLLIVLAFLGGTSLFQYGCISEYTEDDACSLLVWFHGEHDALVLFLTEPARFE